MRPSLLPGLLAAARAQRRARRRRASACSRSAGAISADGERPTLGLVLAGDRAAAPLARRQGGAASTPMTPRRRRWPSSPPPARRSTICRCSATRSAVYHPGQSGAALPRAEERARRIRRAPSARSPRRSTSTGRSVAAEIFLDAIPQKRGGVGPYAQRLCAAAAAGGDARLRLPRAGRAAAPTSCCARCAAPTRRRSPARRPVRRLHRPGRARRAEVARGRGRRCSRARRASPRRS